MASHAPGEGFPGALSWHQATQGPLSSAALPDFLADTAIAVYCELMPSWSAETGLAFQLTPSRIRQGWEIAVQAGDDVRAVEVPRSAGRRALRQVRTALTLIVYGPTRRHVEDWAAAWELALWECSAPGCSRSFRRWGAVVRHERWVHHRRPASSPLYQDMRR